MVTLFRQTGHWSKSAAHSKQKVRCPQGTSAQLTSASMHIWRHKDIGHSSTLRGMFQQDINTPQNRPNRQHEHTSHAQMSQTSLRAAATNNKATIGEARQARPPGVVDQSTRNGWWSRRQLCDSQLEIEALAFDRIQLQLHGHLRTTNLKSRNHLQKIRHVNKTKLNSSSSKTRNCGGNNKLVACHTLQNHPKSSPNTKTHAALVFVGAVGGGGAADVDIVVLLHRRRDSARHASHGIDLQVCIKTSLER